MLQFTHQPQNKNQKQTNLTKKQDIKTNKETHFYIWAHNILQLII